MRFRFRLTIICLFSVIIAACFCFHSDALASDNGLPEGYEPDVYNAIPAQQFKDVFETETITITGIEVTCDTPGFIDPFNDTVHFRVFNSTTQETEYEIDTVNNHDGTQTLPDMKLKKNHNYIFFVEDPQYRLSKSKYVQVLPEGARMATEGPGAYDYKYIVKRINPETGKEEEVYNKEYEKLTAIRVYRRNESETDPQDNTRCCIGCTIMPAVVTYKGNPVQEKLKFRFVSETEERMGSTNYLTEGEGILYANLLEDITYMVYLDSDKYVMDPFPIVVKDKSEYGEGRYAYNHTTCVRVDAQHPIKLYDSIEEAYDDEELGESVLSVTSLKGNVTVSGMNFRHLLILDRQLDKDMASGMDGKDYEVVGITAVNPHRWEISKLLSTEFSFTKKIEHDKLVSHVYYIDGSGKLNEIGFSQKSADEVGFNMDSLSLYPVVIEYDRNKTYSEAEQEKADQEREEREKAEREQAEIEKAAREKAEQEKAERERAAQEQSAKEAAWKGLTNKKYPVPSNVKVTSGKKKATVKWKKLTSKQLKKAGKVKLEIQYSLNRKFPMSETKSKYIGKTKKSLTIKSLKSRKTYYVRVRTFRTINGTKHVSRWSKTRKVKIR